MVILKANGHKTRGNFPFVQKRYIIISTIKYYNYDYNNIITLIKSYTKVSQYYNQLN